MRLSAEQEFALPPLSMPNEDELTDLGRLGNNPSMDVLTTAVRDSPARHQDLRSALSWSHDLLPDSERRVLRRLSVLASVTGPARFARMIFYRTLTLPS